MTFSNAVELWEYQHGQGKFMDAFVIHAQVNKETLLDYLLYDYGNMRIVENHSDTFHDNVDNFFKIHKWNIDKLAETLNFKYDPIGNIDWSQTQDFDRGQDVDSTTDRDVNVDRDLNTDRTEDINTTKKWDEKGSSDEEDKHFVSAYNDESRDTPKSRDTIHKTYEQSGNDKTDVDDDENIKTTEDIATAEDIVKNEKTKEEIDVIIKKKGHDGNISYQSLIEEERKQAEFNLYKWIGNHFAKELLICLW